MTCRLCYTLLVVELRAGLFDLDGCLLDSELSNILFAEIALNELGIVKSDEEIKRELALPWAECVQKLLPQAGKRKIEYYKRRVRELQSANLHQIHPFPGVSETLYFLKEKGVALAVVSNREASINILLDSCDLRQYFQAIVYRGKFFRCKPDPEPSLVGCRKLDVLPSQVFGVGDSVTDMLSYRSAGVNLLFGVDYGYDGKKLYDAGADHIISRFDQIPAILELGLRHLGDEPFVWKEV